MNEVLLTVSGTIPENIAEQIAAGERPLADYIAMARGFPADLLDYRKARAESGWLGRMLEKVAGPRMMLAWRCFQLRRRYQVIFTDGEQIGIPLALLLKFLSFGRRPRHLMIGHILSVGKKMRFFDWLQIQSHIDIFLVYSTWQKEFIQNRWSVSSERVLFTPFMVDSDFFASGQAGQAQAALRAEMDLAAEQPIICAVGLEFRDYPTLLKAVEGMDVQVIIAAASPWSKREDSTSGQTIPANVIVRRFSQFELRDVYAMSNFVVMPLYNVDFQAGVTAILEGMAMGKAVICSRTPGQTDVIIDGKTGVYVPPGDASELRQAINHLLQNPELAAEMGENGRQRIINEMNLAHYVSRLKAILH
jgi:glycosyltransferase involved in cell wall biosynthesis